MKVSAIICEYNPMHNGHVHHIRKTRENGATHIIGLLSSNFVQRGDVALLDKFDRAKLAIHHGVDLVIELPVAFSNASAELYATGAVSILNNLGIVDELSFGSSCSDLECLELLTEASLSTTQQYLDRIRDRMRQGDSYPAALWEIVRQRYGNKVAGMMHDPNNMLAIEYMKAMHKVNAGFKPFTIERQCVIHDSMEPSDMYASASFVRKSVAEGDMAYLDYVPEDTAKLIAQRTSEGRIADVRRLERLVLHRIRTMQPEELLELPDVNESLQNRIYAARHANSWDELLAGVKARCFTMSRIRRIMMAAVIGIRREDLRYYPPYARVIAFNERGRELMGNAKKKSRIPIGTSLAKLSEEGRLANKFVRLEERATDVYGLSVEKMFSAEQEFRMKIVPEVTK